VDEVVTAALQEDVQGIAISSYQGGHVEYFKYMVDLLRQRGGAHIQVFGGGGGVIVASEISELQATSLQISEMQANALILLFKSSQVEVSSGLRTIVVLVVLAQRAFRP
jgi:methylmalonyl-CoA mutase cobalamin-binding domain/chain